MLLYYLIWWRNFFKTFINYIIVALYDFFILIVLILVLILIVILVRNLRICVWVYNLLYILFGFFWIFYIFNCSFINLLYSTLIILHYLWVCLIIERSILGIFYLLIIIINKLLLVKCHFLLLIDFFIALNYLNLQIMNLLI